MSIAQNSCRNVSNEPQCQFFVIRKKRLCRMTVRTGRQYCGEHEPQPKLDDDQIDTRIPCPNDPKHTCYASKLEKHLAICNARQQDEVPPYIVYNINAPATDDLYPRRPLSEIPRETVMKVIDKVNLLYDKHIKDNITSVPDKPIHHTVVDEFSSPYRSESSRRHLRQASSLLHLAEAEALVADGTCYVELGAGKGQLSYYACVAWCGGAGDAGGGESRVLLVDRAALRHKRDNKLRDNKLRVRADLAHLALGRVPLVADSRRVVGFAKHLCGVATDYALRCLVGEGVRAAGALLATCCHHRCERASYVANARLQELGIDGEDLNTMLGIVSWATCGDGRSRDKRNQVQDIQRDENNCSDSLMNISSSQKDAKCSSVEEAGRLFSSQHQSNSLSSSEIENDVISVSKDQYALSGSKDQLTQELREQIGRKAKALLDWGRVLYLREKGFDARLCYYVPTSVSLENELGIDGEDLNTMLGIVSWATCGDGRSRDKRNQVQDIQRGENNCSDSLMNISSSQKDAKCSSAEEAGRLFSSQHQSNSLSSSEIENDVISVWKDQHALSGSKDQLTQELREQIGRKAKALLDWGRVLYLREKGFDARLCYYVPTSVSLENVCILAKNKLYL